VKARQTGRFGNRLRCRDTKDDAEGCTSTSGAPPSQGYCLYEARPFPIDSENVTEIEHVGRSVHLVTHFEGMPAPAMNGEW
jgi:hypothetical protein